MNTQNIFSWSAPFTFTVQDLISNTAYANALSVGGEFYQCIVLLDIGSRCMSRSVAELAIHAGVLPVDDAP